MSVRREIIINDRDKWMPTRVVYDDSSLSWAPPQIWVEVIDPEIGIDDWACENDEMGDMLNGVARAAYAIGKSHGEVKDLSGLVGKYFGPNWAAVLKHIAENRKDGE